MAVRRESVRLELQDAGFSTGMAKNAAATALLARELKGLDGTSGDVARSTERTTKSTKEFTLAEAVAAEEAARLRKNLRDQARALIDARDGTAALGRDTDRLGASSRKAGSDINQLSGRLSLLLRGFAVLGPTLAPISTVAVAGVAGLASQFGFAATGAISLVAAAQGVGDALKAVNEAALEPTAANLDKAREAMAKIGPDAQAFVTRFQEIRPVLGDIRDAAAAGWFPGLTESLTSLEQIAPEVASLFEKIGTVGGNLVAEGAAAFAGPGWADFRSFVAAEAPQALDDLGRTLGNVAEGLAELWMAFGPLNSSFSSWMLEASRGFADWAAGLSQTEGFAEFIDYVRTNGPKVADAAVAIANAVLQIAEAAAPLGGPVLETLTAFANLVADIANSPLGTPIMAAVTAMSALSLATTAATAATLRLKAAQASLGMGGAGAAGAAGKGGGYLLAAVAVATTLESIKTNLAEIDKVVAESDARTAGKMADDRLSNWKPSAAWLNGDLNRQNLEDTWSLITKGETATQRLQKAGAGKKFGESMMDALASKSVRDTANAVEQLNAALSENARITLGSFSATTQYREALKAAQEQAASNNAGIKGSSEAALENRRALEGLAGAWQQQRDEMVGANKSTEEITNKQRGARRAFIDTATAMGVPIKQARRLATELLGIPEKKGVKLTAEDQASAKIRGAVALLGGFQSKTITLTTIRDDFGARSADGSTVPKDGGNYADRYPYLLAPGEEVISNRHGQADRHRPLLKAINAGMLAEGGTSGLDGLGLLAGGGTAGRKGDKPKGATLWFFPEGIDSLKGFVKQLEASRDALQSENDARMSLVKELGDAVGGKFTSSLFGNTDAWSAGGSLLDAIGILNGDTAAANAFSGNVATLQAKGLDDPGALNALLSQADAATIANIAATATPEVIAQYEQSFQARQAAVTNAQNVAMAAQTATLAAAQAATTAKLDQVVAELKALNATGPAKTGAAAGKAAAQAGNKGAGKGSRNRNRATLG